MKKILKDILKKTLDYSGSTKRKVTKGIIGALIVIVLGYIGVELSTGELFLPTDENGNPIYVERDENGTVTDVHCTKNRFNCSDFKTQEDAQEVLHECGSDDVNDLDRDKDNIACEELKSQE